MLLNGIEYWGCLDPFPVGLLASGPARGLEVIAFLFLMQALALSYVVSRAEGIQGGPKSQVCCSAQDLAGGICHRDTLLPGESFWPAANSLQLRPHERSRAIFHKLC